MFDNHLCTALNLWKMRSFTILLAWENKFKLQLLAIAF